MGSKRLRLHLTAVKSGETYQLSEKMPKDDAFITQTINLADRTDVANKKDLDFSIGLYELTPKGEYFQLSWYLARASYIQDPSHRQLLVRVSDRNSRSKPDVSPVASSRLAAGWSCC